MRHGNGVTMATVAHANLSLLVQPTKLLCSDPSTAAMCMRYFPCPSPLPRGGSQGPPTVGSWLLPKLWPSSTRHAICLMSADIQTHAHARTHAHTHTHTHTHTTYLRTHTHTTYLRTHTHTTYLHTHTHTTYTRMHTHTMSNNDEALRC